MTTILPNKSDLLARASQALQQIYTKDQTPTEQTKAAAKIKSASSPAYVAGAASFSQDSASVLLKSQSVTANTDSAPSSFDQWFTIADTDKDGQLTRSEFLAARPQGTTKEQASALFDSMDPNQTGVLDKKVLSTALDSVSGSAITTSATRLFDNIQVTTVTTEPPAGLYEKTMSALL